MDILDPVWFQSNWFEFVQTIAIIATLLITFSNLRTTAKNIRVANSFLITQHHREIWTNIFGNNACVTRIFKKDVDLLLEPITDQERMFVNMIMLHMSAVLKAVKDKAIHPVEGMEIDVQDILSYPIPSSVWKDVKQYHDQAFVKFIDRIVVAHQGLGGSST